MEYGDKLYLQCQVNTEVWYLFGHVIIAGLLNLWVDFGLQPNMSSRSRGITAASGSHRCIPADTWDAPCWQGVVRSNDHMGSFDKNVMVYAVQGAHSWVYLGTCSNAQVITSGGKDVNLGALEVQQFS